MCPSTTPSPNTIYTTSPSTVDAASVGSLISLVFWTLLVLLVSGCAEPKAALDQRSNQIEIGDGERAGVTSNITGTDDTVGVPIGAALHIATLGCDDYFQNRAIGYSFDSHHLFSVAHAVVDVSEIAVKYDDLWFSAHIVHADLDRDIAIIKLDAHLTPPDTSASLDTAASPKPSASLFQISEREITAPVFSSRRFERGDVLWMQIPQARSSHTVSDRGRSGDEVIPVEIVRRVTAIIAPVTSTQTPPTNTDTAPTSPDTATTSTDIPRTAPTTVATMASAESDEGVEDRRVQRGGYELGIDVEKGESGSVLLDDDGAIAAMIFARSTRNDQSSWSVNALEIETAYNQYLNTPNPIAMCNKLADAELELD